VSEDTNTPTIANVADFLELLQSAVIETGPNTGTIDTGINPVYLAECISTLHRAARRLDPDPLTTERKATANDALEQARRLALPSEILEAVAPAQLRATRAAVYAAIAQAEALQRIAAAVEDTFTRGELNVMLMNGQH
jgi:hypothetical protein